jgi:hypothetical protein
LRVRFGATAISRVAHRSAPGLDGTFLYVCDAGKRPDSGFLDPTWPEDDLRGPRRGAYRLPQALELRCTSPQQASAFFQSEQDQLAILVAGDHAVALYRAGPPTMGCGWHSASDLQQAIAQCAIIAEAWSVPGERCSTLCDQDNADTNGICIANTRTP